MPAMVIEALRNRFNPGIQAQHPARSRKRTCGEYAPLQPFATEPAKERERKVRPLGFSAWGLSKAGG